MRYWILGLIILGLVGCGGDITNEEAENIMPQGYKILCSVEGGKYTIQSPLFKRLNCNAFDMRKAAAEHALFWHMLLTHPRYGNVIGSGKVMGYTSESSLDDMDGRIFSRRWRWLATDGTGDVAAREERRNMGDKEMKTTYLKGKQPITALSYQPQEVKDLEDAGIDIIDIVTGSPADPDVISWAEYYKAKDIPVFAARMGHGSRDVKLWIKRTVDKDGELL